jgi:succinate-acetate transporter protein
MANPVIPITPEAKREREPEAQIWLQPVAAPSILGLYGFAGATFIVAAHMAHWFGGAQADFVLFPFAAFFGGLAQFLAGMWAFKARDGLATAMHGMWGSFWMAYGILWTLIAAGKVAMPQPGIANQALGFWFIVLAAITWMGMGASLAEATGVSWVLGWLAAGSTVAAIGQLAGIEALNVLAGWLFIVSAILAWWVASALMFKGAWGRTVLRFGEKKKAVAEMQPGLGEPGVLRGQ